jgi:ribosomal-protein-alanine N-acetyltransferase
MDFKGTLPLETPRLYLRRLTLEDAGEMYRNWASQEEVARYMSWPACKSLKEAEERLADWQKRYDNPTMCYWGLVLKDTGKPIGTILLQPESEHAALGLVTYCLGKDWWGNGYMAEALKRVLAFGFDDIGYNLIHTWHAVSNPASGRVMEKAGMQREAVLRQRDKTYLGYEDCIYYSMLKSEYDFINQAALMTES